MKNYSFEEMNLMCLYNTGTRIGLLYELSTMRKYLGADEKELRLLTDSVMSKLRAMTDAEFDTLDLVPDFDE